MLKLKEKRPGGKELKVLLDDLNLKLMEVSEVKNPYVRKYHLNSLLIRYDLVAAYSNRLASDLSELLFWKKKFDEKKEEAKQDKIFYPYFWLISVNLKHKIKRDIKNVSDSLFECTITIDKFLSIKEYIDKEIKRDLDEETNEDFLKYKEALLEGIK